MENENATNTTTAAEPQGGPSKFCAACGAQLHMLAEICPKCGAAQAPVSAPQGAAASAEPQQGAAVKYCATCGASLHPAAEICPQCGTPQASPPHEAPGQTVGVAQQVGALFAELTREIRSMGGQVWLKTFFTGTIHELRKMGREIRSAGIRAWGRKTGTVKGRASRQECAVLAIALIIITAIFTSLRVISTMIGDNDTGIVHTIGIVWVGVMMMTVFIYLFCIIRRLHDMNLSGWFLALIFIFFILLEKLPIASGFLKPLENILLVMMMIVLAVLPGTAGSNKFGEPPK